MKNLPTSQKTFRNSLIQLLILASLVFAGCATSGDEKASATSSAQVLVNDAGVAVQGYDVVAYFDGFAIPGSPAFKSKYDGATYQFANSHHKSIFDADPKKYLPAFGGYCAFAVAKNAKVAINPKTFRIQNGRLLLFFNDEVDGKTVDTSQSWDKDADTLLKQAEANWPSLK